MLSGSIEPSFQIPIEALPDATVVVREDGRMVAVNTHAERLFGYGREELVGRAVEMLVPERSRGAHPTFRAAHAHAAGALPPGPGRELAARRKDGTEFPAEISLAQTRTSEGLLVTAAIRDVTRRKHAGSRFRAFIEAAPDAIVMVDRHGVIVLVNAATEHLFGYPRAELLGQRVEMLVPARLRVAHAETRAERTSGPEMVGLRRDGSEFPAEITKSPIETEEGTLEARAVRDITSRKNTETALLLANRELESFSYSVAHDLRAPLRAISGFASVLHDNYKEKLDAEAQDWLDEIVQNAQKMGALIDALLSLSRLSRAAIRRESIDLSAIAKSAAARLARSEPGRAVEVLVAEHLRAEADPVLARALIENLLGNAWKFTRDATAARIEVGAEDVDGERAFFVRDNGAGLDMAYADKLFTPFQRLHTTAEFPGTGIGLATARRIVQRHGGRIWVNARLGEGAVFHFTLPTSSVASEVS